MSESTAEPWPCAFELVAQIAEVVDLAVGDDLDVAGLVENGCWPPAEVDDRQPAHPEADAGQRDAPLLVRAAMVQHAHHAVQVVSSATADPDRAQRCRRCRT